MYNEYPDLIYEGLISDSFYTDIVEEGIGESIKNKFSKIKKAFTKAIDKVIEKWKWLIGKIRQGINKIKDKFRKGNNKNSNTNKESNTNDINTNSNINKKYTVKYKFKSKEYIKDFDECYEEISKVIDDFIKGDEQAILNLYHDIGKYSYSTSMEEVKFILIDLDADPTGKGIIATQQEIEMLMNIKPEKYTTIINKLKKVSEAFEKKIDESAFVVAIPEDKKMSEELKSRMRTEPGRNVVSYMKFLINVATLILEQVASLN